MRNPELYAIEMTTTLPDGRSSRQFVWSGYTRSGAEQVLATRHFPKRNDIKYEIVPFVRAEETE